MSLINDRKIFLLELKNKLDDGGFDGTDLYDNFKIINKRIQANFFNVTLELFYPIQCYLATCVVLVRRFEKLEFRFKN